MTDQKTLSTRAWAELALLSLLWGGSFLAIRLALDEIPVLTSVAHRVSLAALVLWAYVLIRRLAVPRSAATWAAFLIMGLLNNVIPFSLMAWGQLHIESGLTSILNATTAIFGVLVAALVFADERLTLRKLFGVALGFAGVTTAIGIENLTRFDPRSLAQMAVIAGTVSYACAGAWGRRTLSDLPPEVAAAGMLTGSALVMVPLAWIVDGPFSLPRSAVTYGAVAYYAIAATAMAYMLYYRVLAMAGAGNLLLCTLLVPPVAIALGALVLGEALPPQSYAGFLLIAAGMLVIDGRLLRRRGLIRI